MRRDLIDFHYVRPQHIAIHDALGNWVRVVQVHAYSAKPSPMFSQYRSTEVWQARETQAPPKMKEGWDMEKAVSALPRQQRDAVRWHYVFSRRPPGMAARQIGVHQSRLHELVHEARSMLTNRA